ncbi:hypothetical protein OGAPHI_000224 [Ogataea philodendri]|uniref:3-hydroxyisobutyryl-CoA hydrolase n=1 Tax=Ogataea philodendri TaxID=1378263 RepID=A0A9P8TA51_9ASCO|nr:uncharacterized protein OGAPHI_000224 [Ogataea philodendri]KAH3671521.1 hypothetical protein OGAPHI_000224 [Ogataea philodendri]
MNSTSAPEVEFSIKNRTRIISLNRPAKLNAITTNMCDEIVPRLVEFSRSDVNDMIIINSKSPKAFCSGGDVIQCAKNNLDKQPLKSVEFFQKEYSLNYLLSVFNKPVVSLVKGIVMGGGVGLSVHGPFRVVCESTRFAMPETNIGFFSDVGTSFWLPKLDGNLGYYLALTGDELFGLDTLIAGYGTHYVPSHKHEALTKRLTALELPQLAANKDISFFEENDFPTLISEAIEEFTEQIPSNHKFKYSAEELDTIETCFNPDTHKTVEKVIEALVNDGSEFALNTIKKLEAKSQISLKLSWELLLSSRDSTIHGALSNELNVAAKLMLDYKPNDFNEYILKNLINRNASNPEDKELHPKYATLTDVPEKLIKSLVSRDNYQPDENGVLSPEQTIESLEALKVSKFEDCPKLVRDYDTYPWQMGLPTQEEIEKYIKGEDDSNRKYSVTAKEAGKYFIGKFGNRNGVVYKVKHVLDRKTKPNEYGSEYLEWK